MYGVGMKEYPRDTHSYTVGLWLHHVREREEDWGVLKRTVGNLTFLSVCVVHS